MQNASGKKTGSQLDMNIEDMFDRIAFRYDFLNSLLSLRQDRRWRRKLVSALPEVQEGKLLDIACGTGDVLQTALRQRKDYVDFTGVDISKAMLALADKKLTKSFLFEKKSLTLKQMSAESLSFADNSFDALTISFGLRNVENKEKALSEFLRILKPGASLFVLEFFNSSSGFMSKVFRFYFHVILPFVGGVFSDKKAYSYLPQSVDRFYTLPEFQKRVSQLGFENIQSKTFLWGACVLVEARKPRENEDFRTLASN